MNKNALVSWSGGKDSCFATLQAIAQGYAPKVLLNVLNEKGKISRSHGISSEILQAQAHAAQLPIHLISSSWQEYEQHFTNALKHLKEQYDLTYAIFGDIDLEPHREWEEKVCNKTGLKAYLPLWKQERRKLVIEMLEAGIETIIVSCNKIMGERFLGEQLTPALVYELEALGVDPCGENGEFHTLVTNCSLFKHPIEVSITQNLMHDNYWFCQLALKK